MKKIVFSLFMMIALSFNHCLEASNNILESHSTTIYSISNFKVKSLKVKELDINDLKQMLKTASETEIDLNNSGDISSEFCNSLKFKNIDISNPLNNTAFPSMYVSSQDSGNTSGNKNVFSYILGGALIGLAAYGIDQLGAHPPGYKGLELGNAIAVGAGIGFICYFIF
jgi:hypothetical protein